MMVALMIFQRMFKDLNLHQMVSMIYLIIMTKIRILLITKKILQITIIKKTSMIRCLITRLKKFMQIVIKMIIKWIKTKVLTDNLKEYKIIKVIKIIMLRTKCMNNSKINNFMEINYTNTINFKINNMLSHRTINSMAWIKMFNIQIPIHI